MRNRMARNRGGWPVKAKTIFDAKAHARANRALDRLANAIEHNEATRVGEHWDAVIQSGDRATAEAYDILADAMNRVSAENNAAQKSAQFLNSQPNKETR